jgi:hypothetical protein
MKVLEDLARTASSSSLRKRASDAVQRIERNDPLFDSERRTG